MAIRHRRSPKNLTLNKVFPDWATGSGIMTALNSNNAMPWNGASGVESTGLDIVYHGARSGGKFVTPLVYNFIDDDGEITDTGLASLVSAIKSQYLSKWTHLWALYTAQYSPLNSYNISETMSRTNTRETEGTDTRTDNLSEHKVVNDDTVNGGTDTTVDTPTGTNTTVNSKFAFNSADWENTEKSVETPTVVNTETVTHGKTENRDVDTATTNTGTQSTEREESVSDSENYSKTKQGTMFKAPAELMEADREFWREEYFNEVYADLDQILTLAIFADSEVCVDVF